LHSPVINGYAYAQLISKLRDLDCDKAINQPPAAFSHNSFISVSRSKSQLAGGRRHSADAKKIKTRKFLGEADDLPADDLILFGMKIYVYIFN